jgi:predicted Zn-dependent protease
MANGTIWVNTALLNDTSDDELAVVLGHELAHYTYEHSRRSMKDDMWRQLAAPGANAVTAKLSLLAWGSGYSRNLEDQADRVGLRYAYEAGFDVGRTIDMFSRERSRFGGSNAVTNWFSGGQSRPTDRIKNIRRELQLNYRAN